LFQLVILYAPAARTDLCLDRACQQRHPGAGSREADTGSNPPCSRTGRLVRVPTNGRAAALASERNDRVIPCLIGREAHRIEEDQARPVQGRRVSALAGDDERGRRRQLGSPGHQGQGGGAPAQ
jgi:hypothetical protein